MAGPRDVVFGQLQFGQLLIEKFTADFSDEEYFTPSAAGANHAGWILGHVAYAEDWAVAMAMGSPRRLPETMAGQFGQGSGCVPDPSRYPSRPELDDLFRSTRAHTREALEAFDESRWDDPSPQDVPQDFFPTLGALWSLTGFHQFWHIGQLTTCRAVLGKKQVLFDA